MLDRISPLLPEIPCVRKIFSVRNWCWRWAPRLVARPKGAAHHSDYKGMVE